MKIERRDLTSDGRVKTAWREMSDEQACDFVVKWLEKRYELLDIGKQFEGGKVVKVGLAEYRKASDKGE